MSQRIDWTVAIQPQTPQSQKLCDAPEEFSWLIYGIDLTAKPIQVLRSPHPEGCH